MSETEPAHRLLFVYVGAVCLVALAALAASWLEAPPVWSLAFLLLLAAVVVSENFALAFPTGASISIAFPLTIAAVVLLGPTTGALVGAGDSLSFAELRSKPPSRIAYNTASVVLVSLATGWSYIFAGGTPMVRVNAGVVTFEPFTASTFASQLVPMLTAAVVAAVGNVLLTSIVMALAGRGSLSTYPARACLDRAQRGQRSHSSDSLLRRSWQSTRWACSCSSHR